MFWWRLSGWLMILFGGVCAVEGIAGKITSASIYGVQARIYGIAMMLLGIYILSIIRNRKDDKSK
ncbi:MAG: hypothetical protein PHD76_14640 [Methylacidiphilales bacterium]|nr:hypothetical protein [Candidatus Methylacidiphilales bacterium]